MRSVGGFVVLFSNYNDARVAVAPLCRAAAATACRLPSSLHSTQRWLVGWRKSWIFDCRQPRAPYGVSALTDCRSQCCKQSEWEVSYFGIIWVELSSSVAHYGLNFSEQKPIHTFMLLLEK